MRCERGINELIIVRSKVVKTDELMPIAIETTLQALEAVVQSLPLGTNLALLHLMWGILNGSFLSSRGAIFPALLSNGFSEQQIRRSWQAMRYGAWSIDNLLHSWRDYVKQQGEWQFHEYEGYRLGCRFNCLLAFTTKRMDG
jgi:hypothetical protein